MSRTTGSSAGADAVGLTEKEFEQMSKDSRPSRRQALLGDRPGSYAIARQVRMSPTKGAASWTWSAAWTSRMP